MNLSDINWTDVRINQREPCQFSNQTEILRHLAELWLGTDSDLPYSSRQHIGPIKPTKSRQPSLSDHYAVFVKTPDVANCGEPVKRKIYLWKKADENKNR